MTTFRYLIFLATACVIWHGLDKLAQKRPKLLTVRNLALLLLCLFFYSTGSIGGIAVLLFQIITGFAIGRRMARCANAKSKKTLFVIIVVINLSTIIAFKYLQFLLQQFGINAARNDVLAWLSPLGVSFYSLEIIAYVSSVYHKKTEAESNPVDFALFVSFFPTILSGPIERAERVLPQLKRVGTLSWDDLYCGSRMIISGFFRKVVIANQLAIFTDEVFNRPDQYSGLMIIFATLAYSLQIYCDFSGYSEIAVGSARFLGIRLINNFELPYFSRSIKAFWRRWHISLSSWFRDYLYIPLGGNRVGPFRKCLNTFIVFTASGLWHGASWTFILWGAIHGIYMIVESLLNLDKDEVAKLSLSGRTLFTFLLVSLAWIPFRANSIADVGTILQRIMTALPTLSSFPGEYASLSSLGINSSWLLVTGISLFMLYIQDWYRRIYNDCLRQYGEMNLLCSVGFSLALVAMILLFGVYGPMFSAKDFIYFQF